MRGRAAAMAEEETNVEVVAEETSLSGVDGGGGDWWSREQRGLREFYDEKQNDMGWTTI
jgi:hypothetical protein